MITIESITPILTKPATENLVIVKVQTSEPGLYGLGCATFTQRCSAVAETVRTYLDPLLRGRDVSRINELWRLMHVNGYWRHGPVVSSAISGVDQALWDIKGKVAGMPVHDLLGGKVRQAAAVYMHAAGRDHAELLEAVQAHLAQGVKHIRVQLGGTQTTPGTLSPVTAGYGGSGRTANRPDGALDGTYYDPIAYPREIIDAITHVRQHVGDRVQLIHDVHSRLSPIQAIALARELEPLNLFFLEDALAPEDLGWYERMRQSVTVPQAVGELFVHPGEWLPLVTGRLIDFLRLHVSAVGGLTPAIQAAMICEAHGVRTAWHGPKDTSPVGHAANLALDVSSHAFGIQEFAPFTPGEHEVFIGLPELREGYLYPSDKPGWGIEMDEVAAARYPISDQTPLKWTQARLTDGSLARP